MEAATLIKQAKNILLATHLSPDGDAIGSLLGMYWLLKGNSAAQVTPYCIDAVPESYKFLPGSELVTDKLPATFDCLIILDCGDFDRVGESLTQLGRQPDLNFDHHATNPGFARLNFVEPQKVSTTQLLHSLAPSLGLALNPEAAECLLCGLVTDTLGFRTSNTTALTLETAQQLVRDFNLDLARMQDLALNRRSFQALKLWGYALSRLQRDGQLVWTVITNAARAECGYNGKGDADVINALTAVNDANIFVTITENEDNKVKISWRARPGFDVSKIAVSFGGGGHVPASGATINGSLAEVEVKVISATKQLLNP